MDDSTINFAEVRPWWVKPFLLFIIGSPLLGLSSLPARVRIESVFVDLAGWCAYAVFVWIFIALVASLEQLLRWLCVALFFGLTVAISGAVLRKVGIWRAIEAFTTNLFGMVGGTTESLNESSDADAKMVLLLIRVMSVVPLAMLAVQSMRPSAMLRAAMRPSHGAIREWRITIAIFIRVFQHVFEIAERMLFAWQEENPHILVPRFRGDWRKGVSFCWLFLGWLKDSVWTWSIGLLLQALLFVPIAVRDWSRFTDRYEQEL